MWHLHDPSYPGHNPGIVDSLGGDPLLDVYRSIDRGLATLASRAAEDTVIVVWCSHGMGPHYDATFLLDVVLQKLEHPTRGQFPPAWFTRARKLWSWIPAGVRPPLPPTVRAALPSAAADRQRRRYFTIPDNNEQGAIRVNLIGRDAHGLVQPGAEYDAVLSRLREALLEVENAETGTRIVTGFQYPQALHPGPYAHEFPDMTVEWDRSRPISKVRSPRIGVIERTPDITRSGDHTPDGILWVVHPGVRPGDLGRDVNVVDLAPTIAHLLAVPHDGFDGTPILEFGASPPS
jgi:predicted AlkP superfamily phosphohydrolase/phosphomutase